MKTHSHICYLSNGSIYGQNGNIIENPAILLDRRDGCVLGWGESETVTAKFTRMAYAYNKAGFKEDAECLLALDFSDAFFKGVTNEEVCYILRRAVEYTATLFQTQLCQHAMAPDFREWLRLEMEKMPIDCTERFYD